MVSALYENHDSVATSIYELVEVSSDSIYLMFSQLTFSHTDRLMLFPN